MKILGIDTAGPTASVALVQNGALVAEESGGRARTARKDLSPALKGNHAEIILPLIQSILVKSGCRLDDLAGLAVSIGPGSFTGLRIGLATVKGLAYECGLPVVGISTLLARAARAKNLQGLICSMLDARKREVYVALFRSNGAHLIRLTEDSIMSLRGAAAFLQSWQSVNGEPVFVVGDGAASHEEFLIGAPPSAALISGEHSSVAAMVAVLAEERFRQRSGEDLGALAPLYLRPSEAERKVS